MRTSNILRQALMALALATLPALAPAGPAKDPSASPEGLINLLYRNYAWEAIGDIEGVPLQGRELQELRRYFTAALAAQIRQDHECVIRSGDMCRLDADIIFDTQDPLVFDLKIAPANRQNEVVVSYKDRPDEERQIRFKMVNTEQGWRIDDILYGAPAHSLRAILAR